jgi:hypothetical protein
MRKISASLLLAAISLTVFSCSNFTLPERVHVKAGVNPNIPINSKNFNFSEKFQQELNTVFTGQMADADNTIGFFNYEGDANSDLQKFLLSFSIKEQSLDFEEYLNEDLDIDSNFQSINKTFKVEARETQDEKILIDMTSAIDDIKKGIELPTIPSIPIWGTGSFSTTSLPTHPHTATGFSSLSFYSGNLEIKFSVPNGQNTVILSNLKINSIDSSLPSYTLNSSNRTATVAFPLADKTLDDSFNLSLSYSVSGVSPPEALSVAISFSDDVKLKTAKGVNFDTFTKSTTDDADSINPGLPPEFVQAVINKGAINLDAGAAIKGINLDLSKIKIKQADADTNPKPSYTEGTTTVSLEKGLNVSGPSIGQYTLPLAGQTINPNLIMIGGDYTLSVLNPADTEIIFNQDDALEIDVSFDLESFSTVYIDGQKVMDDFNNSKDSEFEIDLSELGQTIKSIEITEVGAELTFRKSHISDLKLAIDAPVFKLNKVSQEVIIPPGKDEETIKFTNNEGRPSFRYSPFTDPKVKFELALSGPSGSSNSVLKLTDIALNQEVTIIDCTPKVIFEWKEATIDPTAAASESGGNDFTHGTFPGQDDEFSLAGNDLEDILNNIQFDEGIEGYLFFSGPELSEHDIKLTLTSFPNSSQSSLSLYNGPIKLIQTVLELPKEGESFTRDITKEFSSTTDPIPFTDTFNRMLPSANSDGDALSIKYKLDFGEGLIIEKKHILGPNGVDVFKADLVIILPLKLKPKPGTNGAEIDATEYLGEMVGRNLLDFTENTGDAAQVSFNTLTLNIGLTGAPIENGFLIIERDLNKDGVNEQIEDIPLGGKDIRIMLADYLGASQKFTLKGIKLKIKDGGSLQIPRGLSLLNFSVNAGVDVTYDF